MKSDDDIIQQFKDHKKRAERGLSRQKDEDKINYGYFAGNKTVRLDIPGKGRQKPMVSFNKIKAYVASVAGFMVQTRRKPSYQAMIEDSQEQQLRSQDMNAIADYFRSKGNADQIETRQDIHMLICGYGAIDIDINYNGRNPAGEIKYELCTNETYWDPEAKETNLLDARFVYRRKKMLIEDAELLWGANEEDLELDSGEGEGVREYNPAGGRYDSYERDIGDNDDMCNIYAYQWWEYKPYYRVANPLYTESDPVTTTYLLRVMQNIQSLRQDDEDYDQDTLFAFDPRAKMLTLDAPLYNDLNKSFKAVGVQADFVSHNRQCYYTAILSGKKVFKAYKNKNQDGFTVKFKTADYDEINKCWFGIVSLLREPAKFANKAITEMLYVIASNSKGGVVYEKGAVSDPAKFESQYASTQAAVMVNDGSVSGNRIMPKAQAALPTGYENIYSISDDAGPKVIGLNPEYLGTSDNKQVSALLERQRINQVITTLATYFDSLSLYLKEQARLMITNIRILTENSEEISLHLLTEEGARQFFTLTADKLADEYDVDIGEAPETATEKEYTAELLTQIAQSLLPVGVNIYPAIISALPIKDKYKQAIIQILQPQPQQPDPMAQALTQSQINSLDADSMFKHASAVDKHASALQKVAQTEQSGVDMMKTAHETAALINNQMVQPQPQQPPQPMQPMQPMQPQLQQQPQQGA